MNEKVLFVVSSNFQMMFAYIISHYINEEVQYMILDSQNPDVNDIAKRATGNNKSWSLPGLKKTWKGILFDNKKLLKLVSNIVRTESPTTVILFKDNDFLTCQVIETASKLGSKIILVQEGVGIYDYPERNMKKWLQTKLLSLIGYPWIYDYTQGLHPKVNKIAAADLEKLPAIKKRSKELIKIPHTGPPRYLLNAYAKIIPECMIQSSYGHPACLLYIGQPLSRLGITKLEDEIVFLQNLLLIAKKNCLKLIVKPHPYEDLEKYDVFNKELTLLSNSIPAEMLPLYLSLSCIITPYSSAADNISSWFQTPILYVHNLLLKQKLNIDHKLKGYFVKDYDELNGLIKQYSKRMNSRALHSETESELGYQQFATTLLR